MFRLALSSRAFGTTSPAALKKSPRNRRDDLVAAGPAAMPPGAMVSGVEAVEPVPPVVKRWRATLKRARNESATVEFDAPENFDSYAITNELAAQIPEEAWALDPVTPDPYTGVPYVYVDRVDEVIADPSAAAPATLSRRGRAPSGRKELFEIRYPIGNTYAQAVIDAATAQEAIMAYLVDTYGSTDGAVTNFQDLGIDVTTIDEVAAMFEAVYAGDPLGEEPVDGGYYGASALARRARKSSGFEVWVSGQHVGDFAGATPEDAIAAWLASGGYATPEDAALALGFASIDDLLAAITTVAYSDVSDEETALLDTLSRRRRKFARKAAFQVLDPAGAVLADVDAATADEALQAYLDGRGDPLLIEDADLLGMTFEDYVAAITAVEVATDPATDPVAPDATLARVIRSSHARRVKLRLKGAMAAADVLSEIDALQSEAEALVALDPSFATVEDYDAALAELDAMRMTVEGLTFDGTDPDNEATASQAITDFLDWLAETVASVTEARDAVAAEADGEVLAA